MSTKKNTAATKPLNRVLAHHENGAALWELPNQGVYLTHPGSTSFVRICSKAQFDSNQHTLRKQGWDLESDQLGAE